MQSNCNWCGATFIKKNSVHKFCSSSCKKKSWRKENSKPEFPTFIQKPVRTTRQPSTTKREYILTPAPIPPTPSIRLGNDIDIDKEIERLERRKIAIMQTDEDKPVLKEREPVISKNPLRDAKERKVMDTVMAAFDEMLVQKRKSEIKLGFHSKKEIEKKIIKLEGKRQKVIRQVNKLNKAIRKYVKDISKDINKGRMSNNRGQSKIDKVRDKEVKDLVDIVKNRDWILLYDEDYYFV